MPIAKKARIKNVKAIQKFLETNGYHQLLRQPIPRTIDELYRTASMAYAWMPTMLEFYPKQILIKQEQLIKLLRRLNKLSESEELELLMNVAIFINHSLVGAIKTLHILNPERYPLMDSRTIRGWNKMVSRKVTLKISKPGKLSTNLLFTKKDSPDTTKLEAIVAQYFIYRSSLKDWQKAIKSKDTVRGIEFKLYLAGFKA